MDKNKIIHVQRGWEIIVKYSLIWIKEKGQKQINSSFWLFSESTQFIATWEVAHTNYCSWTKQRKRETYFSLSHWHLRDSRRGDVIISPMLLLPLSRSFFLSRTVLPMAHSSMSSCSRGPDKARLRGVVFDMDGTLTVPVIDFAAMYRSVLGEEQYKAMRAKSPSGIDILHHIETWSPDKQQKAYEIIVDFERQGLDRLQIMPGISTRITFLFPVFWCLDVFDKWVLDFWEFYDLGGEISV